MARWWIWMILEGEGWIGPFLDCCLSEQQKPLTTWFFFLVANANLAHLLGLQFDRYGYWTGKLLGAPIRRGLDVRFPTQQCPRRERQPNPQTTKGKHYQQVWKQTWLWCHRLQYQVIAKEMLFLTSLRVVFFCGH